MAASQEAPAAAVAACLRHADAYQNVPPGSATFNGVAIADAGSGGSSSAACLDAGGCWRLRVDVAGIALSCLVTPDGKLQSINPVTG